MMPAVRIIIVGAGASGIATACRLLGNGFTDITILEAEDRIGGRIHTEYFGDGIIDLGAQWVHGEKGNVVFNMANPQKLLTESITSLFDNTTVYVDSSGRSFQIHEKSHIFKIISDIDADSKNFFKTGPGSVGDFFTSEFKKRLKEESVPTDEWPLANSILDWYEKLENSIDASDSWFKTSGNGLTQYWDCEGNLLWSWKSGGYKTVFDLLMKKDSDENKDLPVLNKILYNKEVENISWDHLKDDNVDKVIAKCTDGSTYIGDHIIVTVSLGVLKERANSLFLPSLPNEKLVAIKGLAIGIVDKIFLKFSHQWWPKDLQGFNILWSEADKQEFLMNKTQTHDKSWLQGVFGFWCLDNQPLVLYTWAVGTSGKKMEKLTDAEVVEDLMELLHRYLGRKYNIPAPDEMRRSTWGSNAHFCGSYSFRSMESDQLNASAFQLAQPVLNSSGKQVLLFAGEASHDHYYSTVHGAIETGWREADRLMKLYRKSTIYKVAIIGAGISGLAAAKTLLDGGISEIIILEAQDRPGGRILSLRHENSWLEAGAQWIHGQNSEVWRLANHYNLLSDIISSEGEGMYLREDGTIIEPHIVHEVYSVVSEILEECESLVNTHSSEDNAPKSIGHHLKQRFIEYLESCHNDSADVKNVKYELYDWHVRFQVIDNSCSVLDKLSARAWGKYHFCGGTDYVNFKEGYSSLITCIVRSLPIGVLNLQHPVKKILWKNSIKTLNTNHSSSKKCENRGESNECSEQSLIPECVMNCFTEKKTICMNTLSTKDHEGLVEIICENGSSLFAEHVIVTCSLGYLKENYQSMFTPRLPNNINKAIEDLGFSTINKVYLIYREPWWSKDNKGFQLIWFQKIEDELNYEETSSWTRDLTGFDVLPNHEAVLLGWVGGRGAEIMEKLSELEIGEHCTALLRKFTNQSNIPEPHKIIKTSWYGNPYVRGAYSNTSTSCDLSKVGPSTMAEPVCVELMNARKSSLENHPALLFAGEATHETFFSTTHGAYETGQKQANVILSYQQKLLKCVNER